MSNKLFTDRQPKTIVQNLLIRLPLILINGKCEVPIRKHCFFGNIRRCYGYYIFFPVEHKNNGLFRNISLFYFIQNPLNAPLIIA